MKRKAMIIGVALACLLIVAVVGMVTPWKAAAKIATPQPEQQVDTAVPVALKMWKNYSTPFVIGVVPNDTYEVTAGTYRTVIKIHNYSQKLATFVWKAVIANRLGGNCSFGAISPWVIGWLPPDASSEIDEATIRLWLQGGATPFTNGFVQVASTIPIDVEAIHTADTAAGKTMDIERVPEVILPTSTAASGAAAKIDTGGGFLLDSYALVINIKNSGNNPVRFAPVNVSFYTDPTITGCWPVIAEFPTLTTDCDGVVQVGFFQCGVKSHYVTVKSGTQTKNIMVEWPGQP